MIILPSRNGMLLRNSNGILASDCGGPVEFSCDCELLTGTNCSCYGTNLTPSTHIADFGEMGKYCLEHVSGCTWQKTVGTITVTLNLTYATNTTRLTVVDGSTTVFSGDLVETDCEDRKYGIISNTVSPSDWGDGVFFPKCQASGCVFEGRFIVLEIDNGSDLVFLEGTGYKGIWYKVYYAQTYKIQGFITRGGYPARCTLVGVGGKTYREGYYKYADGPCQLEGTSTLNYGMGLYMDGNWGMYFLTGKFTVNNVDIEELLYLPVGGSVEYPNEYKASSGPGVKCGEFDYHDITTSSFKTHLVQGTLKITVY